MFEFGGYLQVILLALLAPATTANAITLEKDKKTLDVLLLSDAGPFAIVWGKFLSRLFNLAFLLFLAVLLGRLSGFLLAKWRTPKGRRRRDVRRRQQNAATRAEEAETCTTGRSTALPPTSNIRAPLRSMPTQSPSSR